MTRRPCSHCGRSFVPTRRPYQKYCSPNCRAGFWAEQHRGAIGRAKLLKRYGLSDEAFAALLVKQDQRCAVCRKLFRARPTVDHDHSTGEVRGLLCGACNSGIGMLGDNARMLRAAKDYLVAYMAGS